MCLKLKYFSPNWNAKGICEKLRPSHQTRGQVSCIVAATVSPRRLQCDYNKGSPCFYPIYTVQHNAAEMRGRLRNQRAISLIGHSLLGRGWNLKKRERERPIMHRWFVRESDFTLGSKTSFKSLCMTKNTFALFPVEIQRCFCKILNSCFLLFFNVNNKNITI